jgi:hypothetical protein
MPDHKLLAFASSLRARAEEVLAQAETMKDAGAKKKMRDVAASYEKLAQQLEQHAYDLDRL